MPLIILALAVTLADPGSVVLRFDTKRTWPQELMVQRGTVLHFEGEVYGGANTTFSVRDDGKVVATSSGSKDWKVDWDTHSVEKLASVIEVKFKRSGEEEQLMARIDLQVVDQSPYRLEPDGTAPNGDQLFKLTGAQPSEIGRAVAVFNGADHLLTPQSGGAFRLSLSGVPPPSQHVDLRVVLPTAARFDAGAADVAIPERVFFSDPKPLVINRTEQTLGGAIRIDIRFDPKISPTTADVDLKPGGIYVNTAGKAQILLTTDTLSEGSRQFSIVATMADGTVYLSVPKTIEVRSSDGYVRSRILSEAKPILEGTASDLSQAIGRATEAELDVASTNDDEAARKAWMNASDEVAYVLSKVRLQEPSGLEGRDTGKIVTALNQIHLNWMAYGSIYLQAMTDLWRPLDMRSLDLFEHSIHQRAKSAKDAAGAVRDAADARRNMIQAFTRQVGDLDVDRLQVADCFTPDPRLKAWADQRQAVIAWLSDLCRNVSEGMFLEATEIRTRAGFVRTIEIPESLPDSFADACGPLLDSWSKALVEAALEKEYKAQRARLLDSLGGDQLQATDTDRQRLDAFDQSIANSEKERDRQLSVGLKAISFALKKFPVLAAGPTDPS